MSGVALSSVVGDEELVSPAREGFEIRYITEDGTQHCVLLAGAVRRRTTLTSRYGSHTGPRGDSLKTRFRPQAQSCDDDRLIG
jgi:hypothetical protein